MTTQLLTDRMTFPQFSPMSCEEEGDDSVCLSVCLSVCQCVGGSVSVPYTRDASFPLFFSSSSLSLSPPRALRSARVKPLLSLSLSLSLSLFVLVQASSGRRRARLRRPRSQMDASSSGKFSARSGGSSHRENFSLLLAFALEVA